VEEPVFRVVARKVDPSRHGQFVRIRELTAGDRDRRGGCCKANAATVTSACSPSPSDERAVVLAARRVRYDGSVSAFEVVLENDFALRSTGSASARSDTTDAAIAPDASNAPTGGTARSTA
jgi:hypothetical protein